MAWSAPLDAVAQWNVTDAQQLQSAEYRLLENGDADADGLFQTTMFTVQQFLDALAQRQQRFLKETGAIITRVTQDSTPQVPRYALPSDLVAVRRVTWRKATELGVSLGQGGAYLFYFVEASTPQGGIHTIDPSGNVSTLVGLTDGDGPSGLYTQNGGFGPLWDLKQDAHGNLYVLDSIGIVYKITPALEVFVVAGSGIAGYAGDGGPATSAGFDWPASIALDSAGNLYISDIGNPIGRSQHVVRAVNMQGTAQTLLGSLIQPGYIQTVVGYQGHPYPYFGDFSGDGGPASAAQLCLPYRIVFDSSDNLYITDQGNEVIRKVTAAGTISTIAGTPLTGGYAGDGGPALAAKLSSPYGLAITPDGSVLYIEDNANYRIRAVNLSATPVTVCGVAIAAGNIDTIAGTGTSYTVGGGLPANWATYSEGQAATSINIDLGTSLGLDSAQNVYVGFSSASINQIGKITNGTGLYNAYVGTGVYGETSGPATTSLINNVMGVFLPLSVSTPSVIAEYGGYALYPADTYAMDNGMPDWMYDFDDPVVYSLSALPTLEMEIRKAPSDVGTIGLNYVALAQTLDGTGVKLAVPDEFAPGLLYGALADLLASDGEGKDLVRAAYCERRYAMSVEMAKMLMEGL